MHRDADVAIVGAGPAGCAAAIRLGRVGYRVLLLDRAVFPRDKPCGDYCDPGAVAILAGLGSLPAVRGAGAAPIEGMRIVAQDGTSIRPRFPTGVGLLIRRLTLDAELVRTAVHAGVEMREQTRVLGAHCERDRITLQIDRPPGTVTAALAIVCDGMHSTLGQHLGLLAPIPPRRYTVGAYFSGLGGPPQGELHLGAGMYCGVARFGNGLANVCMALPRPSLRRRAADRAFADSLQAFPRLADELAPARLESRYRSSGPIGFRVNRMVADRLLLAGDAAAQIDPMTGQGIYFALRSGVLAAETAASALVTGDLTASQLAPYVSRRRAVFGSKLRAARALQFLALHRRLTPALIRRLRARPSLASQLIGATGDVWPSNWIFSLQHIWELLAGRDADGA
ncbi:MAG TPA: FAD-dependent monooxygenase [bacterium]